MFRGLGEATYLKLNMCCSSPRWLLKINISVQPRVVRRYDEIASGKLDSGGAAVAPGLSAALVADRPSPRRSCRHSLLENAIP